ncbi:MAG: hypothetical protein PVF73_08160 [Bacteroidales bacterium]|jgi:hypothetical protein
MKKTGIVFILAWLIVFSGLMSCSSAEKASIQRRNLMMPEKTDLPKNSKFQATKKKKTYKPKKYKNKKRKSLY